MANVFVIRSDDPCVATGKEQLELKLLLKQEHFEIMHQTIHADSTVWISPTETGKGTEFFCVLSGSLTLSLETGVVTLGVGDCFFVRDLTDDLRVVAGTDTDLIYVTDCPVFDALDSYNSEMNGVLVAINERDNQTLLHSRNVLRYATNICDNSGAAMPGTEYSDFITAAIFHDVGKIKLPDSVLKKTGIISEAEFDIYKTHPTESYNILAPLFGENVATIAAQHHERLDGSGYPKGLKGDEISIPARILAIADAYDAMTAYRTYSVVKTKAQAAEEILSLPEKFDHDLALVLKRLVDSMDIDKPNFYLENK